MRQLPLILAVAALAACQSEPAARTPAAPEAEARAREALTAEVVAAQDAYHAEHGTYATHWRELASGADTTAAGVRVLVHHATADGWSASMSAPADGTGACVMYHGTVEAFPATAEFEIPERADEVRCSGFAA